MTFLAYDQSKRILAGKLLAREDLDFDALVMAAMRKADSLNAERLRAAFPRLWVELALRYDAPAGLLEDDPPGIYEHVARELHLTPKTLRRIVADKTEYIPDEGDRP